MPAKTDFNVSPYWDDFSIDNDFYRVLFRPGFAVQARELTQLQTILQNQIEQFGNHFFKEGTIVIPGSVAYDDKYFAVKLQSTFGANTVSDYISDYAPGYPTATSEGAIITGATSGVTAQVVKAVAATGDDPDTLFVKYLSSNTTDNSTTTFSNDEEIKANRAITGYLANVVSAQCLATSATATGSAASVTEGIFFIRGFMCRTAGSTITLDKYTNTPSYRIGFDITEGLITPEADTSLLDNATGSSNYAAKGAHRLKITLTLAKRTLTDAVDANFIELARVEEGQIVHRKKATEYSIIADMIARRTDDESGDYVVKHFDIEPRENLNDGTNRGIYTAANGGVETKDTLVIAPGKAYVNGYEIEKQSASFVNIDKARTTKTVNNDNVPFNLGNYAKVDNVYSQPDITKIGITQNPFDTVLIYDKQTPPAATGQGRGFAYGTQIGQARSRSFEYGSGTVAATTATYHHYLFDISMYTKISISLVTSLTAKALITGSTSGATGILVTTVSSASDFYLMQVEGSFQTGETIKSSVSTDTPGAGTIDTIVTYDFATYAKQIYEDTTTIDYTSDVLLDQTLTLTGEITTTASGTTVTGTNTRFTTELVVGDVIRLPTKTSPLGDPQEFRVSAIATNLSLTIEKTGTGSANTTGAVTSAKAIRLRAKIAEEEETVLVYKTPKDDTKTLRPGGSTDTTYSFRKQFIGTTNASSTVTFSAAVDESFDSASSGRAYTLTVVVAGGGGASKVAGDIINISSTKAASTTVSGTGTQTLSITDTSFLGTSADVTLMASITVPTKGQKSKLAQKMTKKTIAATLPNVFGERVDDKTINLSYADVYNLHAVYESAAIGTSPVSPTLTIASSSGTFTVGEIITGSSTSATGRVIVNSPSTTIEYVALTGTFTTNDTVSGGTSTNTASVTATTLGARNITSNWLLDTGQRDSFYDLGRATRKPDAVTPVGQLLFVYDYFSHGEGDYFSVDSYTGQITYANIPQYLSSKVDPESKAPIGQYELRDSLDFRPSVQNQTAPATCPFAFANKNFEGTGASAGNLVVPDDNVRIDFDFYLGRLDILYLDQLGNFITVSGIAAEAPTYPATDNINMMVAKISIAPFTYKPETDVLIYYEYNRRYTMRDIGKLEARVGKLEYATSLGLLERQTDSFQVLDESGFDRFKSGFMVDNFYGHNIGNSLNNDYECAMDPGAGHMRPKSIQNMVMLEEENTSDAQRLVNNYQKTGDLITLPYAHTAETTQPYASRVESVNPFSVTLWAGELTLNPETDVWFDEQRVPSVTIDVEGNYEQMLREQGGNTDMGTIWNSWNTVSTGNERSVDTGGRWNRVIGGAGSPWRQTMTSTENVVDARQERTGTNTRLVERIERVSMGDRVVQIDIVPWMRPRNVNFTVTGLKPNTRVYAFFDRVDVNAEVKPTSTSATNTLLNGALTKIATTVTVDSTTGFPSSGTIGVGSVDTTDIFGQSFVAQEQMTYTGTTATTFTGVTRNTGNMYDEPQVWADNTYVSNQTYGTSLISDNVGTLYGRFTIPQTDTKRFRYGTRTFRLTDSSTNSQVVGQVETSAETPYTATGFIQTKQEIVMSVRNAQISDVTVDEEQVVQQTVAGSQSARAITGVWYDPLAQTVMCDQASGMFVTKVDVYFSAKDASLPVWMEVRDVVNGYPGRQIFPFGKVTKSPADVNVDAATASSVTTFTFDSPIYINSRQEFCIVLASNSPEYKVWIARLGETEIGGTRTISSQPTLGSLFKSQNASTWTPSQYEDLKFTLYRALFTITDTGTLALVNEELKAQDPNDTTAVEGPIRLGSGVSAGIPTLPNNPLDTSSGVASVTVDTGGVGYTSVPTVSFSGGGGSGAAAIAAVTGGAVTAVTMTDPGSGYATVPTVAFTTSGSSTLATATAVINSTSVRVRFKNHAMYSTINSVTISGVVSDVGGSALSGSLDAGYTGTVNVDSAALWPTGGGYVRIDDEIIQYSAAGSTTITIASTSDRGIGSTTDANHEDNSLVHLYMFGGIPLTEINKTHTSISGIETDSFLIGPTTTGATTTISGGGAGVQCTRNIPMDLMQPIIQVMELPNTTVTGALQSTTGSSPSGSQTPFVRPAAASAISVPLNEDYYYDAPQIICSKINETNSALLGNKSFRLVASLTSTDATVSPIIDVSRMGVISIGNRVNEIDASTNVGALTPYQPMTSSSGDNNNAIYITKKIALTQAATALTVLLDAVKMTEADIRVLYKTLRVDSAEAFDDLDWQFFNTDGSPDSTVPISKTRADFKEYKYFAGKNSLGVGTELTEFIAFAIKIVQQGTNTALPSLVKDFRVIAFQA